MRIVNSCRLIFALFPFVLGFEWRDSGDVRWSLSCDFNGNDLANVRTNGESCGGKCTENPGCTHFTWTNYEGGTCWLKRGGVSEGNAVGKNDQGAVCGYVKSRSGSTDGGSGQQCCTWRDSGDVRWSLSCDFSGNDLANVRTNGENCGGKCTENPGCTHFTWTNYEGGTCWLKRGGVSEGNAVGKNNEGAVCGFVKSRNGGGPQANGKSTRYWDCCKPSCSWNGKAAVSAPVKTCAKDGSTTADVNAQSGCGGGPAYTCNNNQPFVIDDNLSYGFAAAHISGQQERDWCCACYELTFTNTAVSGKKYVVQVTNTGGDLGENHFDLQIPGGGVGLFNGCSSQWGAPGDGWGQKYGGVGSAGECDQLPQQLRDGCRWRFNWFRNADNPNLTLKRVKCPSQLTDISGCKRNDE